MNQHFQTLNGTMLGPKAPISPRSSQSPPDPDIMITVSAYVWREHRCGGCTILGAAWS